MPIVIPQSAAWRRPCPENTGMSYLNFPRILLMVMNNGIDVTSGRRFVKDYGNFRDMESFDDLMKAWDSAIRELTRASVIVENAIDIASEREVPDVLCSCLTQDCLGRGKTIKEGGAVYDFISGLQVGIANMADSLAAIKKLVYEEKKISRDELMNALATDFAGEEGERIRQMLIHDAPKYGNDDDYADRLVVDAYASYLDEMKRNIRTRASAGDRSAASVTAGHHPFPQMSARDSARWRPRTDVMRRNRSRRGVRPHTPWIRTGRPLSSRVCPNSRPMRSREACS